MASFTISQHPNNELHREIVELTATGIENLGRQRPPQFKTTVAELGFCFSLLASMLMGERCSSDILSNYFFNVLIACRNILSAGSIPSYLP